MRYYVKRSKIFNAKYHEVINLLFSCEEGINILKKMADCFLIGEPICFVDSSNNCDTNIKIRYSELKQDKDINLFEIEDYNFYALNFMLRDLKKHRTPTNITKLEID